jgi:hypothetical protein
MKEYSLLDFVLWITGSVRLYSTYIGTNPRHMIYAMKPEEKMNFVLLVWNAEGCPEF